MTESIERTEVLVRGPALGLAGLLGVSAPDLAGGEGLPLLWHWVYLLERPIQTELGSDGHPARGGIPVPPGPGRRRMWAGGRVTTFGPLRCDEPATRHTGVLSSTDKQGRTGAMTFVKVGHEISQRGQVVIREEQDIVYRAAAAPAALAADEPGAPPAEPELEVGDALPVGPDEWAVEVSPTVLFRYSALTYNAHRIHYDRAFSRDVEGYPGLLVHGPLQATLMAEAVRRRGMETSAPVQFDYRLLSPLFDQQGLFVSATLTGDGWATSVRDRSGRQTATGTLRPA